MKKKIAIIGAGGFGQEIYCIWKDVLEASQTPYEFLGFYDDRETIKGNAYGEVIGKLADINKIDYQVEMAIAVGSVHYLKSIREMVNNPNVIFPNIIHPSVVFMDKESCKMKEGNIFSANCIVSCNTKIGMFNVFNTRVTLGHDVVAGDYNVFSPNTQISGTVTIGNQNFFGFSSGVVQKKKIGGLNTIAAGSVLLRSVKDNGTYMGVPAKKVEI